MLVESISASVKVLFKKRDFGAPQRKPVNKLFTGKDAKERAEQWAKGWFANNDVDTVVCNSQCVLVNQ